MSANSPELLASAARADGVTALAQIPAEDRRAELDPDTSIRVAREVLRGLAAETSTAPLVVEAWEAETSDDSMFIESALVVGLLVNITLFMAASDIDIPLGKGRVRKPPVSADVIRAVASTVVDALGLFIK